VLNAAPDGEITGTWTLPMGSCGSYAGTLRGSVANDFVILSFMTSTGTNLFLELARQASCYRAEVAAADNATGPVVTEPGGVRRLSLSASASLYFVDYDFYGNPVCVPGHGDFAWAAVPYPS
jgi:hypothetical protein